MSDVDERSAAMLGSACLLSRVEELDPGFQRQHCVLGVLYLDNIDVCSR
jgi:hypothetical protein